MDECLCTLIALNFLGDPPWPVFRHDQRHTALSTIDTSANAGTLKWEFTTGAVVDSSAAVGADGTIYFGSLDNNLYALE
jgi:outer membrane protein assembly factor BamB